MAGEYILIGKKSMIFGQLASAALFFAKFHAALEQENHDGSFGCLHARTGNKIRLNCNLVFAT